jgi:NAD(P)-dependent dehydrogenase (short-subunit alcohol dehydrogenase family)
VAGWTDAQLPDLRGKTALVTGANSGIGLGAARALAEHGAQVVLGCRDQARGQAALRSITAALPSARLELLPLDLASLGSVRAAASAFAAAHERLDILCNNAGVMAVPLARTAEGFEQQLGVNHFGHFALTALLLPRLLGGHAARIVTVSSLMHRRGRMRFDDLDAERGYDKWAAYGQSKLANLLFAYELQRRLERKGAAAISVACHPGYADTNLQQVGPVLTGAKLASAVYRLGGALIAQSKERGAWPTLYAATAGEVRGGDCIGPGGPFELTGSPVKVRTSRASHDEAAAARLWQISVERTGASYAELG